MEYLICALLGYCIGGINPAFIISKIKGFDIRKSGTGNAGASNAAITMGKKFGVLIAVLDIFKAAAAVFIAAKLFPQLGIAKIITGASCVLGHIFPVLMKFRGGKGLACLAGFILAYDIKFFAILLAIELVLALTLDYICVIPITGSIIFTVYYAITAKDHIGIIILAVIAVIILIKHISNLKKIHEGTEVHISFLWKKDKNAEQIQKKD